MSTNLDAAKVEMMEWYDTWLEWQIDPDFNEDRLHKYEGQFTDAALAYCEVLKQEAGESVVKIYPESESFGAPAKTRSFLQGHYNAYREAGGAHAVYLAYNDIDPELGEKLAHHYAESQVNVLDAD